MHGFAKGMDSMPSPPTWLGKGLERRGRDRKLTWALTLQDEFLLLERSTTVCVQPQAPALAQESRQHAPFAPSRHTAMEDF